MNFGDLSREIKKEFKNGCIKLLGWTIPTVVMTFIGISIYNSTINNNLKIETVDRIQGLTVDYTIFLIPNASVSYSLNDELFNVATSRAIRCTIIIADRMILKSVMSDDVRRYLLKINEN